MTTIIQKNVLLDPMLYGATYEDRDYYVSASSGSVSNPGTALLPFDDISTALAKIPHFVDHAVHIHVQDAGSYTITKDIYHIIREDGQISIDASQVFVDVDAGPYTVLTWTPGGPSTYEYADITVSGTPFVAGALVGKFVRGITGTGTDILTQIMSNTTNSIRLAPWSTGYAVSDTFKIVEPGADVVITDGIGIHVEQAGAPPNREETDEYSRFAMIGLNQTNDVNWYLKRTNIWIQYCVFNSTLRAFNCRISDDDMYDFTKSIDETVFRSVWDMSFYAKAIYMKEVRVYQLWTNSGYILGGEVKLISCGICDSSGTDFMLATSKYALLRMANCYIENPGYIGIYVYARLHVESLYIEAASYGMLFKNADAEIDGLGGNGSNISNHVLYMSNRSSVGLDNVPTVTGSTGTGEIYWPVASTESSYPASGNAVTDGLFNVVSTL